MDTTRALTAIPARAPGSDAERRAALWLAAQLRGAGRDADVRTHWVRPQWPLALALHAALAVAGSVVAVSVPAAGLGILAATLVSLALDLSGRAFPLRLALPRRATQNVVATAPGSGRVRLIVSAHYDAPRSGLIHRDGVRRAAARLTRGHVPSPLTVLLVATALLTAIAGATAAGADSGALRVVQLLVTIVPLLALALAIDIALSRTVPGANDNASGVAVALALVAALDRAPPANLAVEVVLAGAGESEALGMRAHVRGLRAELAPEQAVVLDLLPCGRGRPCYWTRDGAGLSLRLHPRLVALAAQVAAAEPYLDAAPHRGHGSSGAYAARAAGYPAIAIGCLDRDGIAVNARQHSDVADQLDPKAMQAALELALGLVDRLDAEVGRRGR